MFSNYVSLKSSLHSLNTIYEFLKKSDYKKDVKVNNLNIDDYFEKILFNDLDFSFDDKIIFKKANFEINEGQKIAILGPSGSGKSTLINILIGILSKNSGRIYLNNKEINSNEQLTQHFKDIIAIIPQKPILMESTLRKYYFK